MLRLVKAFWDIALWRRTPAQLPASPLLLAMTVAAAMLLEVLGAFLPPVSSERILLRIALSVGLPLAFAWVVLAVAHRRERFLQTASALLGIAVLAELVLYPIGSLIQVIGQERLLALPFGILMLAGLIGYLLACANVWRSALDGGVVLGICISVGYLVLSIVIEQAFLPET